jgi:hypothetical protein
MSPGCPGITVDVTFMLVDTLEPHKLSAVTEIVPPVAPGVAVIEADVELPLHPDGNDHVYDVAPVTEATLYI